MKPPFDHQLKAVEFFKKRGYIGGLYWEMGCGKCRAVIETFKCLRKEDHTVKMVVVAPLSILESGWGDDIKSFSEFTYFNAHDSMVPFNLKEDILLVNFESMAQKKNVHITKHIRTNLLVVDESSKMKNHKTITTKTLLSWQSLPKYKIIMSGTPAPNNPIEYWGQIEFLHEWTLHKSFFAFRNTYFHLQRGSQVMPLQRGQLVSKQFMREVLSQGWKYEITKDNLAKLMNQINPLVFWLKKDECLSLPDQVDEVRLVELGVKQRKIYNEMKNDLITEIKNTMITAQLALAKCMKLREITSGFAIDVDSNAVDIGECPKMQELLDVIAESGDHQIIIWACFKWDIEQIFSVLEEKYGLGCVRTLYSATKDHMASINDFKGNRARFLVANQASAAHGLTFVNCSLQIFFSIDYSLERYEQAKARIHRAGQTKSCTYIHLIAKNTIDEQILKVLRDKGNINQVVYELLRR